jgi:uncharacterized Zn finger protein
MWDYYERSSPITVKGGIKAQSKRGKFSLNWWGKRWIEAIESFDDSGRLSRGRSYASKGQVLSIDIDVQMISAKVQGSKPTPYKVTIEFERLSTIAWNQIIEALSRKAIYTARLLAGELPSEIEGIFREVNIKLLPSHYSDLKTDCNCPDLSNNSKHITAVLYLLGEEFDRDPFLLFKARGIEKDKFLNLLEKSSSLLKSTKKIKTEKQKIELSKQQDNQPLKMDTNNFWKGSELSDDWLNGAFGKPNQNAVLIKSLGKFPFWRGEVNLHEFLATLYQKASHNVLELLNKPEEKIGVNNDTSN